MPVDKLDLVGRRRDVVAVFPNEKEFAIRPFRLEGQLRLKRWSENPNDVEELLKLLRCAVPDATDDDFNLLSVDEDIPRILAAAAGKIALLEEALKNGRSDVGGDNPASPPSEPSSPTTTTSTS